MATTSAIETWSGDTRGSLPTGYAQNSGTTGIAILAAPSYLGLAAGANALQIAGSGFKGLLGPILPGSAGDDTFSILFAVDAPAGQSAPAGSAFLYFDQSPAPDVDGYYVSLGFDTGAAKIARNSGSPSASATIPAGALLASTPVWIVRAIGPAAGQNSIYVVRAADGFYLTTNTPAWQAAAAPILTLADPSPPTAAGAFQFAGDTAGAYWIGPIHVGPAGTPSLTASPASVATGGTATLAPLHFTGAQAVLSVPPSGGTLAGLVYTAPSSGSGTATIGAAGKFLATETASAQVAYASTGATGGTAAPPSFGLVSLKPGGSYDLIVYSIVAGSYPIAKVELFIISATIRGDASLPVQVNEDGAAAGSLMYPRGSHQYRIRVTDSAPTPSSALSPVLAGCPVQEVVRDISAPYVPAPSSLTS